MVELRKICIINGIHGFGLNVKVSNHFLGSAIDECICKKGAQRLAKLNKQYSIGSGINHRVRSSEVGWPNYGFDSIPAAMETRIEVTHDDNWTMCSMTDCKTIEVVVKVRAMLM